jgi:hypothetical protein
LHKEARKTTLDQTETAACDREEEIATMDIQLETTTLEQEIDTSQHEDTSIPLQITLEAAEGAALQGATEVTKKRTDRLPSTSVLEEITADENIGMADGGNDFEQVTSEIGLQTQQAANTSTDDAEVNIPSQVPYVRHEAHISKNIQNGLDLWVRIREYDQRMADEGFTQVLSKAQKQARKNKVIGKPHYQTRAKGGPPPSSQ